MWENTFTGTTAADKFGIFRLAINERLIDDVILVTVAMVLSFGFSRSSCVRMQIIFVPAGEHTYAHKVTRRAVRLTRANHSTRPADRSSGMGETGKNYNIFSFFCFSCRTGPSPWDSWVVKDEERGKRKRAN